MERKTPINRLNKFFSGEDEKIDIEMGREATEGDNNVTLVLYRVDRTETQATDIYNEAAPDSVRYHPPVELHIASFKIEEPENKAYNGESGTLRYSQNGKLTFKIYIDALKELDVDISFGDFIGYAISETETIYYEVVKDGLKGFDNAHTMMGYKRYYRTIVCSTVEADVFSGK